MAAFLNCVSVSYCLTRNFILHYIIIEWGINITVWADCMELRIAYIAYSWLEQVSGLSRYLVPDTCALDNT